jgi:hypothetical protein
LLYVPRARRADGLVLQHDIRRASFVEWPWKYGLKSLFTERCSQHMNDVGWRGDYARWVCFGWLNLFDDNHCH